MDIKYSYAYLIQVRTIAACKDSGLFERELEPGGVLAEAIEAFNRSCAGRRRIESMQAKGLTLEIVLASREQLKSPAKALRSFTAEVASSPVFKPYVRDSSLFRSVRTPERLYRGESSEGEMSDVELISRITNMLLRRSQEDDYAIEEIRKIVKGEKRDL